MGTIVASTVLDKVASDLQDARNVRWPRPDLLGFLHEAMRATVTVKPTAYVRTASVRLVPGTRQHLPDGGLVLMDVTRNMGADGKTPGRAVRITRRAELDARAPSWHSSEASGTTRHYIPIEGDPASFFVYPPSTGNGHVEVVFGASPPAVGEALPIPLDDIYEPALMAYMRHRAHSKSTEVASATKAANELRTFMQMLGVKTKGEADVNPKTNAPAATPAA